MIREHFFYSVAKTVVILLRRQRGIKTEYAKSNPFLECGHHTTRQKQELGCRDKRNLFLFQNIFLLILSHDSIYRFSYVLFHGKVIPNLIFPYIMVLLLYLRKILM